MFALAVCLRRCVAIVLAVACAPNGLAQDRKATYRSGVAKIEITPAHPIRLNGFGFRRTESEGVYHKIWARALAIDTGDGAPTVLLTVDVLGIPADVRDELVRRLAKHVRPERLALTATHTHTGPMLKGANPTLFGLPIPPEHQANIDRYTPVFIDRLEAAATQALADLKPARLSWGVGTVDFAINRRTKAGPVDHDLPVLFIKGADDTIRAAYLTYACHAVTLSHNRIGGDWPGFAAEAVEDAYPGAVALVSIGCGADQNPSSGVSKDRVELAMAQGRAVAAEVKRLATQFRAPINGPLTAQIESIDLPLAELPNREQWEEKAKRMDAVGHHARVNLERIGRRERLPTKVPYPIQTWAFGKSLAMVHLPGEVVVDYSRRLKSKLDVRRLWLTAYANNAPCYIPSERVLKEGGYEGGGAMIYYDLPGPFAPGLEDRIVRTVTKQLPAFAATFDASRTGGSRPLSPQQSLAAIRTRPGLRVDVVAAEPLVADPVALAFGADRKLWVAEMADYPSGRTGKFEPGGRIVFLEDEDQGGFFDKRTVFLDGLPFPTGVLPWRKGVLICAAPDILFAEDTNGDGKADVVTKLYSGFGTTNYQARVNSLQYGLDGWVYGSCGLFGGNILCHRTGQTVALGDRDFRIKPDTGELEPATGRTQQGRVRDDWDNWFGCDNSSLCRHYPLPDHYLRRNPHVAAPISFVPTPAPPLLLHPVKADAQRFKLSGPPGKVTAACGLGIYRDDLLGPEFAGNTFTCEPVHLLVHRRQLTPKGATFLGTRPVDEAESEFLASTDNWFRPVHAIAGPDGGLWIADMYRFLIEHPRWIPAEDLARIDSRAGAGLGRIYRVRADGKPLRPWPRLDTLDTAGLVAALDSPGGWQRDMATQLLVWRNDSAASAELARLARSAIRPTARLHALVALAGLGPLDDAILRAALRDLDVGVRRHAIRLAEPRLDVIGPQLVPLVDDPDPQIRLQLALTLGQWRDDRTAYALAQLVGAQGTDPILAAAAMSSLTGDNLPTVAAAILKENREPSAAIVRDLLATAVGTEGSGTLAKLLSLVTRRANDGFRAWQLGAAAGALDALERRGKRWPAVDPTVREALAPLVTFARADVDRSNAIEPDTVAALPLLGRDPATRSGDLRRLASLMAPTRSPAVESAALAALTRLGGDDVAPLLVAAWPAATPDVRARLLDALFARPAWQPALFDALDARTIPPSQVDASRRQRLTTYPDDAVRRRALKAFAGAPSTDRAKVIASYESTLDAAGDRERGKAVFARACAACHRLDGVGAAVGPDLAALADRSRRYLLSEILDPNRNLDSRYLEYLAETRDGRVLAGVLAAETATSITLRGPMGKEEVLLRSDLESLRGTSRSLMPEGLEKDLPPRNMADLLAYLAARKE